MKRMKLKLVILLSILVCAIPFMTSVAAAESVQELVADPINAIENASSASPMALPEEQQVEYVLPYPGILPDHPLYVFKKMRDRIMEWLISDPLRKVEFYILQGDKAINSAIFLSSQKKYGLAAEMIVSAKVFKETALSIAKTQKTSEKDIPPYVRERLQKSTSKQLNVLKDLSVSFPGDQQALVKKTENELQQILSSAEGL